MLRKVAPWTSKGELRHTDCWRVAEKHTQADAHDCVNRMTVATTQGLRKSAR